MAKLVDLRGRRYGKLVVISHQGRQSDKKHIWLCLCECGKERIVTGELLRKQHAVSCGCVNKSRTHGESRDGKSKEYSTWKGMKQRCYDPKSISYKYYGKKNIRVCDRWLNSFENFLSDLGRVPIGHSLDRKDSMKDYSPENCKWSTYSEQNSNTSQNIRFEYLGRIQTLKEWCVELNLKYNTTYARIFKLAWNTADAFEKPKNTKKPKMKNALLLILAIIIALPALSQSKVIITGKDLKILTFPIPNFTLFSGTPKIFTSTDLPVKAGSTGSLSLDDSSKVFLFLAETKGLTLNYTVTGGITPPTPTVIEAESTTTYFGMNPGGEPGVICCIQAGSYAAYPVTFASAKTKLTVRYTRGSAGNGTLTLRNSSQTGTVIATLALPSTGGWQAFGTAVFTIPGQMGAKVLYVTSAETGPANPDRYTFE